MPRSQKVDELEFEAMLSRYESCSDDELYAALVPESVVCSLDGRIKQGKESVARLMQSSRTAICKFYHDNKELMNDGSELLKALADYLPTVLTFAVLKLPVVPVALLLCRAGLHVICKKDETK